MPAKVAAKKSSKKEIKRAAKAALVIELRKIRPQLVGANAALDALGKRSKTTLGDKKITKRFKVARKSIDKVLALLGK